MIRKTKFYSLKPLQEYQEELKNEEKQPRK